MTAPAIRAPRASDTAEAVRELVLELIRRREPARIRGAGRWLDAGRPVRASARLDVPDAADPVEYVPGDLTITVPAGMRLARLRALLAEQGQWAALDPAGDDDGTVGATVATASAGALAHQFGSPRDQVLGLEMVTGRAEVARGGGRVVKNVAGFDLARLATGAWGTVGVITEVTLRLRAAAQADITLAIEVPPRVGELGTLLDRLRASPVAPAALELLDANAAGRAGLGDRPLLLARLSGSAAAVEAQRRAIETIAAIEPAAPSVWSTLRSLDGDAPAVVRWSDWPASLHELFEAARRAVEKHDGALHATVGRGVVRAILRGGDPRALAASILAVPCGGRVVERLPAQAWPAMPSAAAAGAAGAAARLSDRVRTAFDPHGILNPGILGGEPE